MENFDWGYVISVVIGFVSSYFVILLQSSTASRKGKEKKKIDCIIRIDGLFSSFIDNIAGKFGAQAGRSYDWAIINSNETNSLPTLQEQTFNRYIEGGNFINEYVKRADESKRQLLDCVSTISYFNNCKCSDIIRKISCMDYVNDELKELLKRLWRSNTIAEANENLNSCNKKIESICDENKEYFETVKERLLEKGK